MHHSIRPLMLGRMKMNKSLITYKDNFSPPEKLRKIWPVLTPGVHTDSLEAFNSDTQIKGLADIIVPIHDMEHASKACIS